MTRRPLSIRAARAPAALLLALTAGWPVGAQAGLFTHHFFSLDTCFGFLPSASITQMLNRPSRSLVKAISLPSGLKRGCMSKAGPVVSRVAGAAAVEPPIGIR